jgi:hypothetical protein
MVVHRYQAEEVVVCLGNGLRGPVLVDGAHLELLQITPICVGSGGFPGSLICFEGVVGHGVLVRGREKFVDSPVNEAGDVNWPAA